MNTAQIVILAIGGLFTAGCCAVWIRHDREAVRWHEECEKIRKQGVEERWLKPLRNSQKTGKTGTG